MGCCGGGISIQGSTPSSCSCDSCRGECNQSSNSNCQIISHKQYDASIILATEWNVPKCGGVTTAYFRAGQKIIIGAFLWNPAYGYFEVVNVNLNNNSLVLSNPCSTATITPGSLVPSCTPFIQTVNPIPPAGVSAVYLASNFVAPALGSCVSVQFTSSLGIIGGSTISVGAGIYYVNSINSDGGATICNEGAGFEAGTVITAVNSFGNYVYSISVVNFNIYRTFSKESLNFVLSPIKFSESIEANAGTIVNPNPSGSLLLYGNAIGSIKGVFLNSFVANRPLETKLEIHNNFNGVSNILPMTQQFRQINTNFLAKPYSTQIKCSFALLLPPGGSGELSVVFSAGFQIISLGNNYVISKMNVTANFIGIRM